LLDGSAYFVRNINPVMRIVIIGTGNTATVLGRLFQNAGHSIIQVVGRTSLHAKKLGNMLNASFTIDQEQLDANADIYVISVSDNAIGSIVTWLEVDRKLVVHTAASVESEILSACTKNYGVLYPLQSLRKEMDCLPEIPFLVEGNTEDNGALIYDFAKTISKQVGFANGQQRLMTHIAAVVVGNFTNHLYTVAEDFCNKENIDFKMLLPLIKETAERLDKFSPAEMQTGPAIRTDTSTIEKHIHLLQQYPFHKSIYEFLTGSIQRWNQLKP
jgi:predicted short-subunit dehydrogenase-like oxidoreductase (DUF2520 family)